MLDTLNLIRVFRESRIHFVVMLGVELGFGGDGFDEHGGL